MSVNICHLLTSLLIIIFYHIIPFLFSTKSIPLSLCFTFSLSLTPSLPFYLILSLSFFLSLSYSFSSFLSHSLSLILSLFLFRCTLLFLLNFDSSHTHHYSVPFRSSSPTLLTNSANFQL